MANFFSDLWGWVEAMIAQVAFIVGGVLALVAWGAEAAGLRRRVGNLASRSILAVTLVVAAFLAWREQHDAMIVYNQPHGILISAFVNLDDRIRGFEVYNTFVIENPGAPSIFNWFSESLKANGLPIDGLVAFNAGLPISIKACGYDLELDPSDSVFQRGAVATQTGGALSGVLVMMYPNVTIGSVDWGSLELRFKDVHNDEYPIQVSRQKVFFLPKLGRIAVHLPPQWVGKIKPQHIKMQVTLTPMQRIQCNGQ